MQGQLRADHAAADRQHANRIEALRTDADSARRRYLAVDPSNRLVAASLEAEWNARLEALSQAAAERERLARAHEAALSAGTDERIRELASDFGRVWDAPATGNADRKRLLGLLIEDATLTREGLRASIGLRLRGGKTHTFRVDLPRRYPDAIRRMPRDDDAKREIRALVDQALDNATVAEELNRRGRTDARGDPYTARCIQEFRSNWNWPSCTQLHRAGLREQGYVSEHELASTMGIHSCTVRQRAHRKQGIEARRFKVGRRTFTMYKELSSGTAENCDPGLACPRDPGLSQQNEKDAS